MACNVYKTIKKTGISKKHIQHVVSVVLKQLHDSDAELSVHCVGEKKMKTLNTLFRGIERPTDVLSFATDDDTKREGARDVGDIFLCPSYIKKQAKRFDVSFHEEATRMLIHGILHLRGYDHIRKKDATKMFTLQESMLASLM